MKKYLLPGLLLIISTHSLLAQTQPLSSTLFIQQDKDNEETEAYQCIQIRRGDKITLTGRISLFGTGIYEETASLILTSDGGRVFLLKGELLPELTKFFLSYDKTERITLKGTVLFEGLKEMSAEMEVYSYERSKKN